MNKFFKSFAVFFVIALFFNSFIACSDDESSDNTSRFNGEKWLLCSFSTNYETKDNLTPVSWGEYLEFTNDVVYWNNRLTEGGNTTYSYMLSEDKYILYDESGIVLYDFSIISKNEFQLILLFSDGNYRWYTKDKTSNGGNGGGSSKNELSGTSWKKSSEDIKFLDDTFTVKSSGQELVYDYTCNSTSKTISYKLNRVRIGSTEFTNTDSGFEAYWNYGVANNTSAVNSLTTEEYSFQRTFVRNKFNNLFAENSTKKYSISGNTIDITEVYTVGNFKYYTFSGDDLKLKQSLIYVRSADVCLYADTFSNGKFTTTHILDNQALHIKSKNQAAGTYSVSKVGDNIVMKLKFTTVPSDISSSIIQGKEYTLTASPSSTQVYTKYAM